MDNRSPAELTIVTSIARAVRLYPLTQWNDTFEEENRFLRGFKLEFQQPRKHQATFTRTSFIPAEQWFCLFDEAEKEIMEDEYAFYGICYKTMVKLARKRLTRMVEKIEDGLGNKTVSGSKDPSGSNQAFYHRDVSRDAEKALKLFDANDDIVLTFVFADWPNVDEARKREYVKEVESKLLGKKSYPDEMPF